MQKLYCFVYRTEEIFDISIISSFIDKEYGELFVSNLSTFHNHQEKIVNFFRRGISDGPVYLYDIPFEKKYYEEGEVVVWNDNCNLKELETEFLTIMNFVSMENNEFENSIQEVLKSIKEQSPSQFIKNFIFSYHLLDVGFIDFLQNFQYKMIIIESVKKILKFLYTNNIKSLRLNEFENLLKFIDKPSTILSQ